MEYLQIFNTSTLSSFCWCALSAVTSTRMKGDDFRYCPSISVEAKLYFFCISTNHHVIRKYYFMIFVHEAYRSESVSLFGSYIIPINYHVQTWWWFSWSDNIGNRLYRCSLIYIFQKCLVCPNRINIVKWGKTEQNFTFFSISHYLSTALCSDFWRGEIEMYTF